MIEEMLKRDEYVGQAFIRIYARFQRLAEINHAHGSKRCDCPQLHHKDCARIGEDATSCDQCGGAIPECNIYLAIENEDLVICERCWLRTLVLRMGAPG